MADTPKLNALSDLILSIFRLHGRIAEWGDQISTPLGLNTTRWQILGALSMASRPLTAPQIAYEMGLTRQGVQKQLNVLMQNGFVEQHINPMHERSHLYTATKMGHDAQAKAMTLFADSLEHATANLSKQEIAKVGAVLKVVIHNLERTVL